MRRTSEQNSALFWLSYFQEKLAVASVITQEIISSGCELPALSSNCVWQSNSIEVMTWKKVCQHHSMKKFIYLVTQNLIPILFTQISLFLLLLSFCIWTNTTHNALHCPRQRKVHRHAMVEIFHHTQWFLHMCLCYVHINGENRNWRLQNHGKIYRSYWHSQKTPQIMHTKPEICSAGWMRGPQQLDSSYYRHLNV